MTNEPTFVSNRPAAERRTVSYIRMEDGTAEDYALLSELNAPFRAATADRVLAYLPLLRNSTEGDQVDRYVHSLQAASRALRDGAEDELVVAALLHDIGDLLAPENHSEFAASILQPYVSRTTHWIIEHHGIFQGYYYFHHTGKDRNAREQFRGHPAFEKTAEFCAKWDQTAFDPNYDTLPLATFEPIVRRIFARAPWSAEGPSF
ncbi:HD domain-containing protein [Bradyrhizobium yuanmingense]|uniref:HD domain-containing protein n=1 Tax=Bradyrhizobium yuanmingense TaxID=108015 RepID=UPI0023B8F851|nr:HD domain-containing protein [Bradyrhizobium yuanmingense]MDF0498864.1 HD domain-containing protein [Bradyrhizobium yuanmingense]